MDVIGHATEFWIAPILETHACHINRRLMMRDHESYEVAINIPGDLHIIHSRMHCIY